MPKQDIDVFVGQRLRALRTSRRLSLDDLARSLGVSYQQIQKYETGANRISASALWHLSKALGVGVADFFPAAEGEPLDASSILAAGTLSRLDENVREIMFGLIEAIERMGRRDV